MEPWRSAPESIKVRPQSTIERNSLQESPGGPQAKLYLLKKFFLESLCLSDVLLGE